jgi:hypothetical protein
VLEWLKRSFARRGRAADVAYDTRPKDRAPAIPAAPPTTPYPPAAPLEGSTRDETEQG